MKTSKPISTISYNTIPYLKNKLETLRKAKIVSFYAIIPHKAEDDEAGLKDHSHVYIEPAKMIQTEDLREEFKEPDFSNPSKKPLGCMSFRSSQFGDWYEYGKHDEVYLASKDQSRRFHYADSDFIVSDEDEFSMLVRSIDLSALTPIARLNDLIRHGMTFTDAVARGYVPIPQVRQYMQVWDLLVTSQTIRNGRSNHNVDEDGCIIEDTPSGALSPSNNGDNAPEGFILDDTIEF